MRKEKERRIQVPDFETFLLVLASIALIVVAFGFLWAIISGLWWLICHLVGWQFTFGVSTAIWIVAMLLEWATSRK
jgi:hypothetical protein